MSPTTEWEGEYLRVVRDGQWEYVTRAKGSSAVVILAEYDGRVILVEQQRVPIGRRCLELPAGLVGDEDPDEGVEATAIKELEEETGFTAERIERLGEFYSSPGMASEAFTLVRAHAVRPSDAKREEGIAVHLVARDEVPAFVAAARERGVAIDVRLLLFLGAGLL